MLHMFFCVLTILIANTKLCAKQTIYLLVFFKPCKSYSTSCLFYFILLHLLKVWTNSFYSANCKLKIKINQLSKNNGCWGLVNFYTINNTERHKNVYLAWIGKSFLVCIPYSFWDLPGYNTDCTLEIFMSRS